MMNASLLCKTEIVLSAFAAFFTVASASATVRCWDGGGTDDKLTTPANWEGDEAPVAGDILVFRGSVRTSPVNDYPEGTSFAALVFANTSGAFTLSGNRMVLTGSKESVLDISMLANYYYSILVKGSGSSFSDTLALDLDLAGTSSNELRIGPYKSGGHSLIFTGTVTGNGKNQLTSMDQTTATLTFEGPVKNFKNVNRPNGNGTIFLKNAENQFADLTTAHLVCQGYLQVAGVDSYGGDSKQLSVGQQDWATPGYLKVDSEEDTTFAMTINVRSPVCTSLGGGVISARAGKTVTLTGPVNVLTKKTTGTGATFALGGAGDGVFKGTFAKKNAWIKKTGSGTWTFASETPCAATGTVSVTEGTFRVDGDMSGMSGFSVASAATLAGTGTVSDVTFDSQAILTVDVVGTEFRSLTFPGPVAFAGSVTVSLSSSVALTPDVEYEIATFPNGITGTPVFTAGSGFPSGTKLTLNGSRLLATLSADLITWKGGVADNAWNTTAANWQGDRLYVDGVDVAFDETAAVPGTVTISSVVKPSAVTLSGSADYTFSGAGISGTGSLTKMGSGRLTIANTNDYSGATVVSGGALTLTGTLKDTDLDFSGTAVFTNAVSGSITGSSHVNLAGSAAMLDGTNTFTGGITLSAGLAEDLNAISYVVANPNALGAGSVTLRAGSLLYKGHSCAVGHGRLLTIGTDGAALIANDSSTPFSWRGDISLGSNLLTLYANAVMTFGEPGEETTFTASGSGRIYVRRASSLHWYSRVMIADTFLKTDTNKNYFYAPGNVWQSLMISVGEIVCRTNGTLACAPVSLGQKSGTSTFQAVLDLAGFDQTISSLLMADVIEGTTQTVTSETPATLTVSNDTDTVTQRQQGRITGKVTLCKRGAGDWSIGCRNWSDGDFRVEQGTLTVTADDVLPTNAVTSTLAILPAAKVVLADGVHATVGNLTRGDGFCLPPGVYGGEGCAVEGAKIRPALFGPGTGSLRVLRGSRGFAVFIR